MLTRLSTPITSAALVLALGLVTVPLAAAQAPASISGQVFDPADAAVGGATVSARGADGRTVRVSTASDGQFTLPAALALPARLTVSSLGFNNVVVTVAATGPQRIVLQPAGVEETVVVIGAASERGGLHPESADSIGSVDIIGGDQIARENVDLSYELLKKVPGVYVNDYNQGVVAGGIGLRGFNTEGDIMHTKLLVDGIPTNINAGNGLLDSVLPLAIDRLEIVKGTQDPRYGMLNIAGNIQAFTAAPGRYLAAKVYGGAFGTGDTQAVGSFSTGRVSHVYAGGYRQSDGYRDHSALDRVSLLGKWFYTGASGRWQTGAIARVYNYTTDAPGYLTPEELAANPKTSPAFSSTDGGEQRVRHISLHTDHQLTSTLSLSAKAYYQTFVQHRWVRFTLGGAQQEPVEHEAQTGALVMMTWKPEAWASRKGLISWGADLQQQDNVAQRFRTADRVRSTSLRDQDFDFSNGGAYVLGDVEPTSWLRINGGLRADRFGGNFTNRLAGTTTPIIEYGTIWQPKIAVMATVGPRLHPYVNYGRSFQVGVGSAAYSTLPLNHSKNDGWEAGVRHTPVSWLALRVGVWGQHASDELRLKFDNSGDSENVGRTRRRGWNAEVTARASDRVYVWGTFTAQKAVLVEPGLTQPQLKGKELNHVPHFTTKFGADVTLGPKTTATFWTEAQDDYFLTTANAEGRFGGKALTNVDLYHQLTSRLAVGVHGKNIFDRFHEYAWFDGTTTLHSPGERRAVYATLSIDLR